MNDNFFYEEINRAHIDIPYVDTSLIGLQYCAHVHEELELVVMREGMIVLTVDGKRVEMETGDIALVRPFQIHSVETPVHSRLYILKILSPLFDFSSVCRDGTVISPNDDEHEMIRDGIYRLIEESQKDDNDPLRKLVLRCLTDQLLISLARLPGMHPIGKDTKRAHDQDVELLRMIHDYLDVHYKDTVSLKDAATACHLSEYYFAHSFKRITGSTFLGFLNGYRLEKVRDLITNTDESFTSIALGCGFSTVRMFNRCFLNHFRMTPTKARVLWRGRKTEES